MGSWARTAQARRRWSSSSPRSDGAARPGVMLVYAGLEFLVLLGWLALALSTFRLLADAGRRDGSIVFSSG